uniref:PLA2-3 n=1 Tax=Demansia vestigiata TaxID=412038 RepID=A6MFM2_DEMVE|nr:PLA2-3 precursor [Demansia vestigiata]
MYPARLLVLLAVCVSLLGAAKIPPQPLNLYQFKNMIQCANRNSRNWMAYAHYGCYCGKGGSGTPVDGTDKCCQTHDYCYDKAKQHPACNYFLSGPSVNTYSYTCKDGELTCKDVKDKCRAFICNCDRTAAMCLAKAPYNTKNFMILDKSRCQ